MGVVRACDASNSLDASVAQCFLCGHSADLHLLSKCKLIFDKHEIHAMSAILRALFGPCRGGQISVQIVSIADLKTLL